MRSKFIFLVLVLVMTVFASSCAAIEDGRRERVQKPVPHSEHLALNGRITFASGTYDHDIKGSLHDKTEADFLGLLLETNAVHSGLGAGIEIETMRSDNLFESQSPAEVSAFELSPYFLFHVVNGNTFRMPVRVGPWFHTLELEDSSSDSLTWETIGARAETEPEISLMRNDDFDFTLFAKLSYGVGATTVHLDASTDEDFDTESKVFGFEFGPRLRSRHWYGSISFLRRSISMDESDAENSMVVRGFDGSFNALAISIGGGF